MHGNDDNTMSAITQKEIARRLVRLRSAIERNILRLNYGGCGVFAVLAARALRELGVAQVEIVIPDQLGGSPRELLDAGQRTLDRLNYAHVGVRYTLGAKVYCMDSTRVRQGAYKFGRHRNDSSRVDLGRNGAIPVSLSYPVGQGLTIEEFEPLTKKQRGWNRSFDRAQIPLLRSLVTIYLVHAAA